MNEMEMKELAEEHYTYVESICHKMYVDAFIHGIKHGQEENNTGTVKKRRFYYDGHEVHDVDC